jgi:glutamine phosphoribosylpyrophosphate amidotransferase
VTTPRTALAAALLALAAGTVGAVGPAGAHSTGIHDNCTKLNQQWPHGVGRKNAVDKTSGSKVTSFYRNTKQYNLAIAHNGTLDRDRDGIACEKK